MRKLNDWTILDEFSEDQRRWYHVRCKCGWDGQRRKDHIEKGRTKSCKACSAKRTIADFPNPLFSGRSHEGVGDLGLTFWGSIQHGATRRGIQFDISIAYAWSLFTGKCALSGVPITISSTVKEGNPDYSKFTASLDRIDSSKGYVEGNVQWVHKTINYIKRDLPEQEFKDWCRLVAIDNPS
jgi:hypothetical protein